MTFAERASTDNLEVAPGVIVERDDVLVQPATPDLSS